MKNDLNHTIITFNNQKPKIAEGVFLAPNCNIIGEVEIGSESSVWFQSVIRGDVNSIKIGSRTNIQDLTMVHVTNRDAKRPAHTVIGDDVTIGHKVIVHGCEIGNRCLIGMGAIVMDRVKIGDDCIVGAGSIVTEGTVIPPKSLAFGSPARVIRELKEEELNWLPKSADHYANLAKKYIVNDK